MSEEEAPRQPWRRNPKETRLNYSRFLLYRDMGPGRSVKKIVDAASIPQEARNGVWQYWRKTAELFHWVDRAKAWDDHRVAKAQEAADQALIEGVLAEAEEKEKQRKLMVAEGRTLRTAGRTVYTRFLALVQSGALENMTLQRIKNIVENKTAAGGTRNESEWKAITELLDMATRAIEAGQKIERLELGEVTDRTETRREPIDEQLAAMTDAQIRALRERLEALVGGGDSNE